ncbi:MAG: outer membrane lipoprotein-sorting protein [Halieaceae bacterium]
MKAYWLLLISALLAAGVQSQPASVVPAEDDTGLDAHALVAGAIDLTRGHTSYAEMSMRIHRPDWERNSALIAWTRGREDALIRFTAPAKDAGNATLKDDERMWTYTPRLNRVIRLPYSLMSQSWAGSDFSYNDLSRTDALLHQYQLSISQVQEQDGHTLYTIEAVPHENAPVVWGREVIELRDDYVLLAHTFYDQDDIALKQLKAMEIGTLGGRVFATRMRMSKLDETDHWTEVSYQEVQFDIDVDDELFTVYSLKAGRGS